MQIHHQQLADYDSVTIAGAVDSSCVPQLDKSLQQIIYLGLYNVIVDL